MKTKLIVLVCIFFIMLVLPTAAFSEIASSDDPLSTNVTTSVFQPFQPRMWFDVAVESYGQSLELELDEFPGTIFKWNRNSYPFVTATDADGENAFNFEFGPIRGIYLTDLNYDGLPEFCARVMWGSGIIDERIYVCDYAAKRTYELSDRFNYHFSLFMKDGELFATQRVAAYGQPIRTGKLAIIDDKLVIVDFTHDEPTVGIANAVAQPGGTVDVTYSIKNNTNGFTTLDLAIKYDSEIYTPLTVTPAGMLGNPLDGNIFVVNPSFNGNDLIRIAFASSTQVDGDGSLFTIRYKVDEKAPPLDVPLSVEVIKAQIISTLSESTDIDLKVEPGLLIIGIMGDINGDGEITPEDAILLLQMYVGLIPWTPRALLLGDINSDGIIDTTDAALILRLVVGG